MKQLRSACYRWQHVWLEEIRTLSSIEIIEAFDAHS
jgi:hypothetical protein